MSTNGPLYTLAVTEEENDEPKSPLFSFLTHRLRICLFMALAMYFGVSNRISLSVGVVCMTNSTTTISSSHSKCTSTVVEHEEEFLPHQGEMDWSQLQQSMLLSASFYGNFATVLFSGGIADQFGAAKILIAALSASSILTLLVPSIARISYTMLLISRVLYGVIESFVIPSVNSLASKWFPKFEKTTMVAFYTNGLQLAAGFGSLFASQLCKSELLGGWPSIFSVFGILTIVYVILFGIFANDDPQRNRWVSRAEKRFLREHVKPPAKKPSMGSAPWKSMVRSKPLHAVLTCSFAFGFATSIMQAFLPKYLKDELGLRVATIGLYTLAPFLAQMIAKAIVGPLTDYVAGRGWISLTNATKVAQSIGSFGATVMLLLLAFLPSCDSASFVLPILIIYGTVYSGGVCGYYASLLAIAPHYTGTISSLSQVAKMAASILSTGFVTLLSTVDTPYKWAFVFSCAAFFQAAAGLHYILCGSAEKESWSDIKEGSR